MSTFDLTQNFVTSYTYSLPFQRSFSTLPKRLTQGWSINGITRFASGFPMNIAQGGDYSLTGSSGVDHPNYIGGLVFSDPRGAGADGKAHEYFNKSAFTAEQLGTMGTADRRFFHGPGINNWDLGMHKETKLRENLRLQLRAEFFNAFNHTQFFNPNGNYSSSRFGIVTSAASPRIGQVSMKLL